MENPKKRTGLWLSELTVFYDKAIKKYEVDIVSPTGGEVPLDPRSKLTALLRKKTRKYLKDPAFRNKLQHSLSPEEIKSDEYHAIYFAGGHGTMWDFPDSTYLQRITREIYENKGVVSAICHGPSALINVKLSNGKYLIEDKTLTSFSYKEERLLMLHKQIPFVLQSKLEKRGANYKQSLLPFTSFVKQDGRLVTGQNPQSVRKTTKKTLKLLKKTYK